MLLALVIVLFMLLLFIIYILDLGLGAYGEYVKENHLEQPSGEELKRLIRKYMEKRWKK